MSKYISFYDYIDSQIGKQSIEEAAEFWNNNMDLSLNLSTSVIVEFYKRYKGI